VCFSATSLVVAAALSPAIVGGASDTSHDAVVSISSVADAARSELCSGVLVAPRVVLTAGHCTQGWASADLAVGVGPSASAPALLLPVASVHTLATFTGTRADFLAGRDIGALVLGADAPVSPLAIDRSDLAGGAMLAVGYGPNGTGEEGARTSGNLQATASCSLLLSFGDAKTTACHGDSGGPLLAAGDGRVVGIVSFGPSDGSCTPPAYAVRVAPYAAWVDALVRGMPDDACASTCPPVTDCSGDSDASTSDDANAEATPSHEYRVTGGCALPRTAADQVPAAPPLGVLSLLALCAARRVLRALGKPAPRFPRRGEAPRG
jgi:secreted trypsin-like serine protease